MKIRFGLLCALALLANSFLTPSFSEKDRSGQEPLLRNGDRVAIVGGGLIERARLNGYLETALTVGAGPKVTGLKFRNLGWSGDTVFNDARSYFGKPQEGRERLRKIIGEWKPTVVLLNYGSEVALSYGRAWTDEPIARDRCSGPWKESLGVFTEGFQKMVDGIRKEAGTELRKIVILTPPPLENLGVPLPDHRETNRRLAEVCSSLKDLAQKNHLEFADLFGAMKGLETEPLTHDGLHFTDMGYRQLAGALSSVLGYGPPRNNFDDDPSVQEIRKAVIEKNRLFFHRWRPANETYLYLFRKHEQGNNAKEIPQFDPLIEQSEMEIERARSEFFKGSQG